MSRIALVILAVCVAAAYGGVVAPAGVGYAAHGLGYAGDLGYAGLGYAGHGLGYAGLGYAGLGYGGYGAHGYGYAAPAIAAAPIAHGYGYAAPAVAAVPAVSYAAPAIAAAPAVSYAAPVAVAHAPVLVDNTHFSYGYLNPHGNGQVDVARDGPIASHSYTFTSGGKVHH